MAGTAYYINKFRTTEKKKIMRQIYHRSRMKIINTACYLHDALFDTRRHYKESLQECVPIQMDVKKLDVSNINKKEAEELWRMYQAHRFDLLGSGWLRNSFMDQAPGFEGFRYHSIELQTDAEGLFLQSIMRKQNVPSARRIWKLISKGYEAIDWQKDYKSGYRWSVRQWYRPQQNAKKPGGDIKVPWELARLQHFPRMAILARKLPEHSRDIFQEFCDQLLDFIAQNPPRMGVNYMCTMDVGIRTANIALAYSMFQQMGMRFSDQMKRVITDFMFQQCNHIRTNLEWSDLFTSNHYFADIAGLLYGSAVLPECTRKDKWLDFAVRQIKQEIRKQFYEEGSNVEGSTAYHRLTGEMAVYSLALIHLLSRQGRCMDAEPELYARVRKAAVFIHDITRPDGTFSSIGDNDSGLFFRLSITGGFLTVQEAVWKYQNLKNYKTQDREELYLDECMNDGRTFCSAANGLCGERRLWQAVDQYPLESSLVEQLMGREKMKCKAGLQGTDYKIHANGKGYKTKMEKQSLQERIAKLKYHDRKEFYTEKGNLKKDLCRISYPAFGIYIYRSRYLYLCINAADNGQKGNAGHAHNDKLSFELFLDGNCILQDSGVYVYTPLPEERNRFRSVQMHNTIQAGEEQNEFLTLFSMKSNTVCRCLCWSDTQAVFEAVYRGIRHIRCWAIYDDKVTVTDYCNVAFTENWVQGEVTCGYGKKASV